VPAIAVIYTAVQVFVTLVAAVHITIYTDWADTGDISRPLLSAGGASFVSDTKQYFFRRYFDFLTTAAVIFSLRLTFFSRF